MLDSRHSIRTAPPPETSAPGAFVPNPRGMFFDCMTRASRWWPALLLIVSASGCDPCAGVAECGGPAIRYRGELIESHSGKSLADAKLVFVSTAGVAPAGALEARTDSRGQFTLAGSGTSAGELVGRIEVLFDDGTVVDTIAGLRLPTLLSPGDSRYLGRWLVGWPHFEAYGQLYRRAGGQVASGVEVEFRRTGGIQVEPDTFVVTTDASGNFALRPRPLAARGELVGDLIIRPAAPLNPITVRGLRLPVHVDADPNPFVGRWGIGPSLPFVGRAVWPNGDPAAGVEVRFQRTGGILVEPESYVETTNEHGTFSLGPLPLESGVVDFTLTFTPPAPLQAITYPYSLRTTDEEQAITLIETWVLPR